MRNNAIALWTILGGFLAAIASIGLCVFTEGAFLNYREASISGWLGVYVIIAFALFLLGAYTAALRIQQTSRRELEIEPSFLVLGCLTGWLVGSLIGWIYPVSPAKSFAFYWENLVDLLLLNFPLSVLLSLVGLRIACQFRLIQSNSDTVVLVLRALVLAAIALAVVAIANNGFPGETAPAEVRQQWASQEFSYYEQQVVDPIKTCKPIIERVGAVKFVAPTKGKNYVWSEPGSPSHSGELTLEVVGEKGSGVGNSTFHMGTSIGYVQFIHQGKSEQLKCS
ncbi:MAG: hypothetical protein KME13_16490 [Myxacorys californica WJT36-NPBG1]|nr:hypothetical protein [Myxacorys californica WJT36-NPBG1]